MPDPAPETATNGTVLGPQRLLKRSKHNRLGTFELHSAMANMKHGVPGLDLRKCRPGE